MHYLQMTKLAIFLLITRTNKCTGAIKAKFAEYEYFGKLDRFTSPNVPFLPFSSGLFVRLLLLHVLLKFISHAYF